MGLTKRRIFKGTFQEEEQGKADKGETGVDMEILKLRDIVLQGTANRQLGQEAGGEDHKDLVVSL